MCGAGGRPQTVAGTSSRRGNTAGTNNSKTDQEEEKDAQPLKSSFKIGVSCDSDNYYNKDPKDPNKYELDGQKGQLNQAQMVEYFVKMCQEHPLLVYIEDPCADIDIDGFRKLKDGLQEANLQHVQIGMKNAFKETSLLKV